MKNKTITVRLPQHDDKLTHREREVLNLICNEFSPGEISERLEISEKTFFNHRSSILKKTQAKTNIGLLRHAIRMGYIGFDSLLAA
jgi:DNA-binding CsgD family transcriptional regulator